MSDDDSLLPVLRKIYQLQREKDELVEALRGIIVSYETTRHEFWEGWSEGDSHRINQANHEAKSLVVKIIDFLAKHEGEAE